MFSVFEMRAMSECPKKQGGSPTTSITLLLALHQQNINLILANYENGNSLCRL